MKIYGPYKRKEDGRWIIIVNGKTVSYPKYLYETTHKVKLKDNETIDHVDENPDNNNINNLRILTRVYNASLGSRNNEYALGYKQTEEHKRSGAKNGMAKLTQEQVDFYRAEIKAKRKLACIVAKELNVSLRTVQNFVNNKSFK